MTAMFWFEGSKAYPNRQMYPIAKLILLPLSIQLLPFDRALLPFQPSLLQARLWNATVVASK